MKRNSWRVYLGLKDAVGRPIIAGELCTVPYWKGTTRLSQAEVVGRIKPQSVVSVYILDLNIHYTVEAKDVHMLLPAKALRAKMAPPVRRRKSRLKKIKLMFCTPDRFEQHICDAVVTVSDRTRHLLLKKVDHKPVKFYVYKNVLHTV